MNTKVFKIILLMAIIVWIGLIFFFSSQPSIESHEQSGNMIKLYEHINDVFDISNNRFFNKIENFVFVQLFDNKYKTPDAKIRKTAHFGIYFVLGTITTVGAIVYLNRIVESGFIGTFLPITIAILDEFNQGLIDRTSSWADVLLDSAGAIFGVVIVITLFVVASIWRKDKSEP